MRFALAARILQRRLHYEYLLPNRVDFQMAESRKSVILVVEDDPDDLELLLVTLGKVGITNPSRLPEKNHGKVEKA